MRASSELQFDALQKVAAREGQGVHFRGEPGSALSGGYAPDLARAEASLIVDEPRESRTPVRENKRRELGGF